MLCLGLAMRLPPSGISIPKRVVSDKQKKHKLSENMTFRTFFDMILRFRIVLKEFMVEISQYMGETGIAQTGLRFYNSIIQTLQLRKEKRHEGESCHPAIPA